VSALTLSRIKTSQEKIIRKIMEKTIKEKAAALALDGFVQEVVLGKIASDIYNESKKVAPLRHVGIRKSKLIGQPAEIPKKATATPASEEAPEEAEENAEEEESEAPTET
jgi:small subunit ribosomal protein S3Ae